MSENILSSICNTISEFSAKGTSTPTIQYVLRCLKNHLNFSYAGVFLKNPKSDMIEILHHQGIFKNAVKDFKRNIGNKLIGRIFFTEPILIVSKEEEIEGYEELIVDKPFEKVILSRIACGAHTMGFLAIYFDEKIEIDKTSIDFIKLISGICAIAIEREEMIGVIKELKRFDPETGLYCLQYFNQKLAEEFAKSARYKLNLTLVLMDVDNFKNIINTFGYNSAQSVLVELSEELKFCIRGIDIPGAFGRDEFILYMPNTPVDKGEMVIKRFLDRIKKRKFSKHRVSTSLSAGVTGIQPVDTLESLIWRAQFALYEARKAGSGTLKRI
ncbi:MAG: GGDEF domain-containing protein [Candidatus Riflebacteria bacterium]|nr:GGDEF domain-containing protein [Candidatus Riflebacteria bacterium]